MAIKSSGGSTKFWTPHPHPRSPNFFNFMQFLGHFAKIVCWCLPRWRGWRPYLGETMDPQLKSILSGHLLSGNLMSTTDIKKILLDSCTNDFVRYFFFYRPKRSFGQGNIFTGVCLSTGGGSSKFSGGSFFGVPPNFWGVSFWGGSSKLLGGVFLGGFLQIFRGGSFKFLGGFLQIFGGSFFGGVPPNFLGGWGGSPQEYGRPVRILLECILVNDFKFYFTFF